MWEGIKTWLTVVAVLFGAAILFSLFGNEQFAYALGYIAGGVLGIGLRLLLTLAGWGVLLGILALLAYLFIFLPAEQIKKFKVVRRN